MIQVIIYRFPITIGEIVFNSLVPVSTEIALAEEFQGIGVLVSLLISMFLCLLALSYERRIKNFINSKENRSFSVTPKLIQIAKVLIGSSLSLKQIELINKGIIDLLSGIIVTRSFKQGFDGLEKIEIKTISGELFTLINKEKLVEQKNTNDFSLKTFVDNFCSSEARTLKAIGNLDLVNRSRIIKIANLNVYRNQIADASNYGQSINCIYNRITGEISVLQVKSKEVEKATLEEKSKNKQVSQDSTPHIPLPIELEFSGNFSETQKLAFQQAAQRWGSIIRGNLSPITLNGKRIDGISIMARALAIDGPKKRLAQAGPTRLRPDSQLPATGIIEFDSADLKLIEENGSLLNVITHEMAHALGFGTLWEQKGLLQGLGTDNPTFIGENAMREYAKFISKSQPTPVPIENMGRAGTQYDHWRESVFGTELMTSFLGDIPNPLSRVTIASLQDIGYTCNYDMADIFQIPSKGELEEVSNLRSENNCQCCFNDINRRLNS